MIYQSSVISNSFADSFWESIERSGVTAILQKLKNGKQTCERIIHAYEARAALEEDYGKRLVQIYQNQNISHLENATSQLAMESKRQEFMTIGESRINLAWKIIGHIVTPLSIMMEKQDTTRKQLKHKIQTTYNKLQNQINIVRHIQHQYNIEREKPHRKQATIQKYKEHYKYALNSLDTIVQEWNVQWRDICQDVEYLEAERLEFLKSSMSNYTQLLIHSLENEIQSCERIRIKIDNIHVEHDLMDFVDENMTSGHAPSTMEYIKIDAHQHKKSSKLMNDTLRFSTTGKENELMMSVMKVYSSDSTSPESEPDERRQYLYEQVKELGPPFAIQNNHHIKRGSTASLENREVGQSTTFIDHEECKSEDYDEKIRRLKLAYKEIQEMRKEDTSNPSSRHTIHPDNSRIFKQSCIHNSITMEQKCQKIHKAAEEIPNINAKDTNSAHSLPSIPSYQEEAHTLSNSKEQVFKPPVPPHKINALYTEEQLVHPLDMVDIYGRETLDECEYAATPGNTQDPTTTTCIDNNGDTICTDINRKRNKGSTKTGRKSYIKAQPTARQYYNVDNERDLPTTNTARISAHEIRDRILSGAQTKPTSSTNIQNSIQKNSSVVYDDANDFYSKPSTEDCFIEFAVVSYDYDGEGEGEIPIRRGDVLGIITKGRDNGPGWWKASVLESPTKVIRTGLVPSNFLKVQYPKMK